MTPLQRWLLALALTTVIVIIGYYWLDRPIAFWVHAHLGGSGRRVLEPVTHIPDSLVPAAVTAFFGLGSRALSGRPLSWLAYVVVACSVSVTMAQATKNLLKYVFGRTWPETRTHDNPSLIHDGAYGFNWFHGGPGYGSFPSGHMAATCAVISVLWICYPRMKPLCVLAAFAVAAALIGANFHFFSDVIAGRFVGVSTGWITTVFFDRERRVSGN
jgi:membrane-associated phospholipid phosphatase